MILFFPIKYKFTCTGWSGSGGLSIVRWFVGSYIELDFVGDCNFRRTLDSLANKRILDAVAR